MQRTVNTRFFLQNDFYQYLSVLNDVYRRSRFLQYEIMILPRENSNAADAPVRYFVNTDVSYDAYAPIPIQWTLSLTLRLPRVFQSRNLPPNGNFFLPTYKLSTVENAVYRRISTPTTKGKIRTWYSAVPLMLILLTTRVRGKVRYDLGFSNFVAAPQFDSYSVCPMGQLTDHTY